MTSTLPFIYTHDHPFIMQTQTFDSTHDHPFIMQTQTFDSTRPMVASAGVGAARRCVDMARDYALERETFGKPLAQHQDVAFKLADMATGVEASRLLTYKAAWAHETRAPQSAHIASMAKMMASEHANKCAYENIQIHGGAGFNCEFEAEKLYRDVRVLPVYEGPTAIMKMVISRIMLNDLTCLVP